MLSKSDRRRLLLNVVGGVLSAGVIWLIAQVLNADLSTVVLVFAVVASLASVTSGIAWWRARARAHDASTRLLVMERAANEVEPARRSLEVRVGEAERRATAAEDRCVAAEQRVRDAELSAKQVHDKLCEVEIAYEELRRWEQLEEYTGLIDYWHQLEGSDQHPRDKLSEINGSLDFMGHGGSKWTGEHEQFAEMLSRIGNNHGKARMLLLNPECEITRRKSMIRFGRENELPRKVASSLLVIAALQKTYDNLHVKVYSHIPHFRLTIVDHRTAIVGHYRSYDRDSEGTPLLAWESAADWSFFTSFVGYFNHEWEAAKDVDWDQIKAIGVG